jgi:nucleotide-binding universal stress UspA family protein
MLARALNAGVLGVHVITPFHMYRRRAATPGPLTAAAFERLARREAARYLAAIETTAAELGVRCRCRAPWNTSAADAILDCARRERCRLIVVGTHGRTGLPRMLLGGVTQKLLARSHIPVVVCR